MNQENQKVSRSLSEIDQEYAQNAFQLGDAMIKKSFVEKQYNAALERGQSLLKQAEEAHAMAKQKPLEPEVLPAEVLA